MAIGLIVRLKTNPGKGPEFEAAFAKQAVGVRAHEPGDNRPNMAGLVAPGTTIEIFDAV